MSNKNLQINKNTHRLLKDVSDKRREEGHPCWSMAAIVAEFAIALHKKEVVR